MSNEHNSYKDFSRICDFLSQRTTPLKIHDLKRKDITNNNIAKDSILNFKKIPLGNTQEVFCLVSYLS